MTLREGGNVTLADRGQLPFARRTPAILRY